MLNTSSVILLYNVHHIGVLFHFLFDFMMWLVLGTADSIVGVLAVEVLVDAALTMNRINVHVREHRVLLQASNEAVQNAESNQLLLVDIHQTLAKSQAQISHRHAGIHCAEELEERSKAHFAARLPANELEALFLQLRILHQFDQKRRCHIRIRILKDGYQPDQAVIDQVLNDRFNQRHFNFGFNSNLCDMPKTVDVGQNLGEREWKKMVRIKRRRVQKVCNSFIMKQPKTPAHLLGG